MVLTGARKQTPRKPTLFNRAPVTIERTNPSDFPFRLTYAITPPNQTASPERIRAIAAAQSACVASLPIDALLVYDVQDEATRNSDPRPFPFIPKVDPLTYAFEQLALAQLPRVVYRAVTDQVEPTFCGWLDRLQAYGGLAVLVGAPSRHTSAALTLSRALTVCRSHAPRVTFGGVIIPERHQRCGAEDVRAWTKARHGCTFFVSQTVWSVSTMKCLLRDLRTRAELEGGTMPRILLTLSPCGSAQTLHFQEWLGVEVPPAVKRELLSARDMFARSIELATESFVQLRAFAAEQGLKIGCNIESVSSRASEIEASTELVRRIARLEARRESVTTRAGAVRPAHSAALPSK